MQLRAASAGVSGVLGLAQSEQRFSWFALYIVTYSHVSLC